MPAEKLSQSSATCSGSCCFPCQHSANPDNYVIPELEGRMVCCATLVSLRIGLDSVQATTSCQCILHIAIHKELSIVSSSV